MGNRIGMNVLNSNWGGGGVRLPKIECNEERKHDVKLKSRLDQIA